MDLPIRIIAFTILGAALDSLTTHILIRISEGEEQNPILKVLLKKFGQKSLIIWFPIEVLLVILFLQLSSGTFMQILILLAPWIAVTINIIQILKIKFHVT